MKALTLSALFSSAAAFHFGPLPGARLRLQQRSPRARPPALLALNVRIEDTWYDLSRWRATHPAGTHWIDGFDGCDATEVMQAFHSDEAMSMLGRLPRSRDPPADAPEPTPLMLAFRRFRRKLIRDGWYERVWWREAATLAPVLLLYAAGTVLARRCSLLATVLLGLGSTSAGWVAHDYVHGRGRWCAAMRGFGALFNGHSASWWSDKHNLHHARTNHVGMDEDIMSDPMFFLWPPDPAHDAPRRRLQHLYAPLPYSLLFLLWRYNSLRTLLRCGDRARQRSEGALFGLHYAWMAACLPPAVALGHALLAGLMSATIVTVSHQSEEMFDEAQHDWVDAQLRSTRSARTSNFFSEWLWGGMQYQAEHHLFPTMPRYRYRRLQPVVAAWCAEHADEGAQYRSDGEWDILVRNYRTLRDVAAAPAAPGAPPSRGDTVWSRRRGAAWVGGGAEAASEAVVG